MPLPQSLRSLVPLLVGLTVGVVGAILFQQSMPKPEGSPEEQVAHLEAQLNRANNRIRSLEADDPQGIRRKGQTFSDRARTIAEAIREGKEVSPDDILRACQPLMRDLSPLFDRVRMRQQSQMIDSKVGELARKYGLNPTQQEALKLWFAQKAEADAKKYNELALRDGTSAMELMKYSMESRPDEGLDGFMGTMLSGEKLAAFQNEQLAEKSRRVQNEADMKVERLDQIVGLDAQQRDQVFGIMARNSKDYVPSMGLEGGVGQITEVAGSNSRDAMMSVLRPEQRAAYEAERETRRKTAQEELKTFGLSLPPNWDMLDPSDF
jgi:uncharacterized protein YoxC